MRLIVVLTALLSAAAIALANELVNEQEVVPALVAGLIGRRMSEEGESQPLVATA